MTPEAAKLATLEERLTRGELPRDDIPMLLEVVRHYRRCRHRRSQTAPSTERRGQRGRPGGKGTGHGRRGADGYEGAKRVPCPHPDLSAGGSCPEPGCGGRLHEFRPQKDVELSGAPPVSATLYERQVLRCGRCQKTFTAPLPPEAEGRKHTPSMDATVAVLRYGMGMPHHRLAALQGWAGVPVSPSTQFERAEVMADRAFPAYRELTTIAANQEVLCSDDTTARVLELRKENLGKASGERTGIFTTGIVASGLCLKGPRIALYLSGRRHAGENLDELLSKRRKGSGPFIHMADAASRNPTFEEKVSANCLVHARRYYVEAEESFPEPCRKILADIAAVYHHDDETVAMTPEERLAFHQERSSPVMEELRAFIEEQLDKGLVEPNSQLGKAYQYAKNHWDGLTQFLRVPGVPLDNNITERMLKTAVRHRKSSLFFKTSAGAAVGDVLMSLIGTSILNGVDPVAYLTAIGANFARVRAAPHEWLPWNYPSQTRAL